MPKIPCAFRHNDKFRTMQQSAINQRITREVWREAGDAVDE